MFNLDKNIAEWRRSMAAGGVSDPEILNELESHLRDDFEQQRRTGVEAQAAFDAAVKRLGTPGALNREFNRAAPRTRLKHALVIAAVIAIGMGFLLPGVAKWRAGEVFSVVDTVLPLLGLGATLYGFGIAVAALHRMLARRNA